MAVERELVPAVEQLETFLTPALQLVIVAVLWQRRSLKRFWVFLVYLIADVSRTSSLWLLGGSTSAAIYRSAWMYSEPVMLGLHICLVWELIRLLYKAYPGIHSFAKIVISISVAAAVLLTLFSGPLDIRRAATNESDRALLLLFQAERVIDFMLALLVALTVGLFPSSRYSGKRIRRHGFLLSALFASAGAAFLAINYGFDSDITGVVVVGAQLLLYLMWIRLFLAPEPMRSPPPPAEEIARLDQVNEAFLVMARWLSK